MQSGADEPSGSMSNGRKNNRPPGLRGKEIGLYYRNLSRQRKKERGEEPPRIRMGTDLSLPPEILNRVKSCLERFKIAPAEQEFDVEINNYFRYLLNVKFEEFIDEKKKMHQDMDFSDSRLDKKLLTEYEKRMQFNHRDERQKARLKLPTMAYSQHIIEAVKQNQVILIVGSTGCGKTTQVPQILLDYEISQRTGSSCRIICTQPRRISAITVSERVAYERGENLGQSVGYQIRLESCKARDRGSINFCTTGVLLQQMQSDPLLHGVSVLILDEIHERSMETDMLMALLKVILPHRPELKVILMSATVKEQDFCDYFNKCPMFRIGGVMFPVEVLYLEDILSLTGYQFKSKSNRRRKPEAILEHKNMVEPYIRTIRGKYDSRVLDALRLPESEGCECIEFIVDLIYYICERKPEGAILVFMPSFERISQLFNLLEKPKSPKGEHWRDQLILHPLHSLMPSVEQQAIFRRVPQGKRKVIISTIIAETSVTIDDVVYVINTGRTKTSSYDIESNIQMLEEDWVTLANTQQRKGRAGRVSPGICYNLFSRAREHRMAEIPTPEILRCKLESIILSLKLLHIDDPHQFLQTVINAPPKEAINNGIQLLKRIECLDCSGTLTPLGMHLAKLPIDPQMGKMILMSALFGCLDPITSAAAALSYKTPFYSPLGQEKRADEVKRQFARNMRSDHLMIHNTVVCFRETRQACREREYCYNNFLSITTLNQLERMKNQFSESLHKYKFLKYANCQHPDSNKNSEKITLLRAIIGAGLYPNMAHLRKARQLKNRVRAIHQMTTDDGRRVNFHPSSVNSGEFSFESGYFVYFQRQKSNDLYLLDSTMVFPMALLIFGDDVAMGVYENIPYLSVAKTYYFKCNEETANLVIELRGMLKRLLLKQALHPAPLNDCGDDNFLLEAIELILSLDEVDEGDCMSAEEEF
ncbi:uncharacterized protein Dwil_GK15229 [Drosophila willistoni]|uniref:RNA helicase n=2 Tax=Drosophila willistoni TaxID=7260 RepID=B4MWB6_DROWI|nr:uncharacterized protein Dwil_GK15229 [Drosophila willistoni]